MGTTCLPPKALIRLSAVIRGRFAAKAQWGSRDWGQFAQEDVEMTVSPSQVSTINPGKWLAIVRGWRPAEPLDVLAAFIKSLMENCGPARVEGLDALIAHTDGTTRSGREKFERLRQWGDKMRADPLYWPQRFKREREVSVRIKAILEKSPRPLYRREIEQQFRKYRPVPPTGLSQELREMERRGEIDRHATGLYWKKGTAPKPYESQAQQLYRLVHDAPGHRLPNAELADLMNINRKDLETLLSLMPKRWRDPALFEAPNGNGVVEASADSLDVLSRGGRIADGRGGTFFSTAEFVARAQAVSFTTLRPERPHVDLSELESEYLRIASLFPEEQKVARADLAARGVDEKVIDLGVRRARGKRPAYRCAFANKGREQGRVQAGLPS